ncbi:motility associated factor glycosyltransferase family protein [Desulfuribacillus alkaliarsenatis]|uniref:6-hydroxymethylpterin diphosphokinase MptE-like domain-containing protein n=1 Tax=Desulfuribacillus alkaliarsenatis TaxID=766136 RepID=A0A1E5G3Q1_9FIRM|nr:6-hydroxymethylpterin diphosphokinase MptE-like protein [Desulfuribacillus alkaliarsenatis]OEF97712.1 hypothetical protein BHF68_14025 [Desulfuribacillus alkaliarsenatis]
METKVNNVVFESNIIEYEKKYGAFSSLAENNKNGFQEVTAVTTKDGNFTIKIIDDNKTLYTNSKYGPINEAQRFVEQLKDYDNKTLFIIYGLSLGYHIACLQKALKNKNNVIIIIEPSISVFRVALESIDMRNIINDKHVILSVGDDIREFRKILSVCINVSTLNNFQFHCYSQYDRIFREYYLEITEEIKKAIAELRVQVSTIKHFAFDFNRNFLNNFPYLINNYKIQALKDKFNKIPAIIVSAGPSLDKNIEYLKGLKDKALIITGGRTLNVLMSKGIVPDLVVSIDPGKGAWWIVKDRAEHDIPLITTVISNDRVIKEHKGKKIFINTIEYIELIEHLTGQVIERLPQGGSVANMCLSVSHYMGCDPIIFVGQDLSFTDGLIHANSSKNTHKDNEVKQVDLKVPGIYGGEVDTSWQLYTFLKWFEDFIQAHSERKYINATQGGAKIVGSDVRDLEEVVGYYCRNTHDVTEKFNEVFSRKIDMNISEVYDKFSKMSKDSLKFRDNAKEALKINQELLNHYNKQSKASINKSIKRLSKLEKEMLKTRENNLVINKIIHPVLIKLEISKDYKEKPNETDAQKMVRLSKFSIELYKGIIKAIDEMEQFINDNLTIIKQKAKEK